MALIKKGDVAYSGGGGDSQEWILSGSDIPDNELGNDNNMYMQSDGSSISAVFGKIDGTWLPFPAGGGGSSFRPLVITEGVSSTSTIVITGEVDQ